MTVAMPFSRAMAKQLLARSARSLTRPVSSNPLLRVHCDCGLDNDQARSHSKYANSTLLFKHARPYATAPGKPASRPKQHTGRTAAKRTTKTTKKSTSTKEPAKGKAKKKVVQKTTSDVKKEPSKTALLRTARQERAALKATALLEEPKQLPSTAFQVLLSEETKGTRGNVTKSAAVASEKYKSLALEERERYNHEANQNKAKNEQAYKQWVQTHSPLDIKKANSARRLLNKRADAAGKKQKHYRAILDDRLVQLPRLAYTYFFEERNGSGDLTGMSIGERGKLVGKEWKNLSAAEKKPFEDRAQADKNRYLEEYKTVYGTDAPFTKKKRA